MKAKQMTELQARAVAILNEHQGKENAINREQFARELGLANVRDARKIRQRLINDYTIAIGLSNDSDGGGYYIITRQREGEESAHKYISQALSMLKTAATLKGITVEEYLGQLHFEFRQKSI